MKKSIQPVLVPVDENNIKDYLAFEKEYKRSLKESSRVYIHTITASFHV